MVKRGNGGKELGTGCFRYRQFRSKDDELKILISGYPGGKNQSNCLVFLQTRNKRDAKVVKTSLLGKIKKDQDTTIKILGGAYAPA